MIRLTIALLLLLAMVCEAEQAVVIVRGMAGWRAGSANIRVSKHVDPMDRVERVLLLAPHGPLVVQIEITIEVH